MDGKKEPMKRSRKRVIAYLTEEQHAFLKELCAEYGSESASAMLRRLLEKEKRKKQLGKQLLAS